MTVTEVVLEALAWLVGTWLLWAVPRCRPADPAMAEASPCPVAVVVPARDEEASLPLLLASVARQRPAPEEVVVVDDHSTDATAAVARSWGARVVAAPPLPPEWTGKAWACWTGVQATTAPVMVFLDADTTLAPGGLERLVAEQRRRGGLLSVQPYHRTGRPYESLSAFFNVVGMMGVNAFVALRRLRRPAGAFGPCLVCTRADYLASGGHRHAAVRSSVLEDVALARRFRARGLPLTCLGGRGTVEIRMYPAGVGQQVEGWTKGMATGARAATPPLTLVLVVAWLSGCIWAAWSAGTTRTAVALVVYVAYAAQLAWMLVRIGRFAWWTAVLFPVPLGFFLVVFARSVVATALLGKVRWRGRTVSTRS